MRIRTELIFPAKLKDEAIICYLCKEFQITLNIVEASFSTDTGWAILIIEGQDTEIKKVKGYLVNKGVDIKDMQQVS